tara:strand:+ start:3364 stop:4464 length:1101 start_codon:yes stop_codon:yes gene_type:complete
MKKLAIFFRNGSRPVPRAIRMMKTAEELGYKSIFCGAFRNVSDTKESYLDGFQIIRVGKLYPLLNGKKILTYMYYTFFFCVSLYKYFKKTKPSLLVASDFEVMIPAIIYSKMYNIRLIYNIHDNLAERYNLPSFIRYILNIIEGAAAILSESAMVPEIFRKTSLPMWCQHKIHIVKNTPGDISFSKPPPFDEKIKLFYGGWLNWGRGIKELINIAESNPNIDIRIAGSGSDDIISFIEKHNSVTYLGHISHKQSIIETQNAHFIPSFYNPSTIINRYAASNKLAEAMAVGRPLLINSEMEIIKSFKDRNSYLSYNYENISNIGADLFQLMNEKNKYLEMCKESRLIFEEQYTWNVAKKKMIELIKE